MSTSRRDFLKGGLSAGAAAPLVGAAIPRVWAGGSSAGARNILVYLQVRGGWDWLNMVIEADHPKYQAARPFMQIPKAKTLTIRTGLQHYWHPALASFRDLFDRGDLAILQNIGYPQPNLSHFESEKKYYAGDPGASVLGEGWLAKYMRVAYVGNDKIPALDVERRLNGMLVGYSPPVLTNPAVFQFTSDAQYPSGSDRLLELALMKANAAAPRLGGSPNLTSIGRGIAQAFDDSTLIQTTGASYQPRATYPNNALAQNLQVIARYITGGLDSHIYMCSTGGFDTHAQQYVITAPETGRLADLLGGVADAVKAFLDDLKAYGKGSNVIVVMQSEFGRRLGENGSQGCDHGHGGGGFVAGEPVQAGIYGTPPDLAKATTPYTRYYIPYDSTTTDFRQVYATVLTKWFGVTDHSTVLGQTFPMLNFV